MSNPITLSDYQKNALSRVANKIVKVVEPDAIICFGMQSITRTNWSCFTCSTGQGTEEHLRFDLLILTSDSNRRNKRDIFTLVRQQRETNIEINCVVHKKTVANKIWLTGDAFFSTILRSGFCVYVADPAERLIIPPEHDLTPERILQDWNRFFPLAVNFLITAEESQFKRFPALTVFLLHQAVEHTCRALIRVCTGHRIVSHNLDYLLGFVSSFFIEMAKIFPCNTMEERELFEVLLHGYSDSRYSEEYVVDLAKVPILIRRDAKYSTDVLHAQNWLLHKNGNITSRCLNRG